MKYTQYPRGKIYSLVCLLFCLALPLMSLVACNTAQVPNPCPTQTSNPVTITMSYSSEKQAWIEEAVKAFNSEHIRACDGLITVVATPSGSGQSMQGILDSKVQDEPDIWSPAGNVWLTLLNNTWNQQHHGNLINFGATDTPSLVRSPVVIAMWKDEAEALGWPNKPIGWSDIAALSTNPKGWAAYGHPEFGSFKFGHTLPDDSNSGLDAVIAENYAAVNKQNRLTTADVESASAQDFVANVESSVTHYGDSTGFFADEMFNKGPGYLSAAVLYENLVVQANEPQLYPHLASPVVAIYPKEGSFYSDHPFAILQGNWVTPAKQAGALKFRDFLLSPAQQKEAMLYGFRPANPSTPLAAPLDLAHGIDPNQLLPGKVLQVPSATVVQAVQASWNQQRRKVDAMLILDRSGSMNDQYDGESKIAAAKQGLQTFVGLLGQSDGLGLTIFSNAAQTLLPVTPLGSDRQHALNLINGITANGSTHLYDTIAEQVQALAALPSKHIKAIILLTDGEDTSSQRTLRQLLSEITPSPNDVGAGIKIFTIAYGNPKDINSQALTAIANATGGQEYAGTPQNIKQIYQQISTFFVPGGDLQDPVPTT